MKAVEEVESRSATVDPMAASSRIASTTVPTVDIWPAKRKYLPDLGVLWEFRSLLYFLTWRDLKVRYKQTILGPAWAVLQPVLATAVFAVFFGRVAHVPTGGVPYLLFAFTGMLAWTFFANGVTNGSLSLVNAATIVSKVYFPRASMPIASVGGSAVDLLCSGVTIIPLLIYYGIAPSARLLALPFFVLLAAIPTIGMALLLAALNVRYRDVKYVVPFFVQIWFFATPVVYSAKSLEGVWKTLYSLNPMVGVIDGFRWSIIGAEPAPGMVTVLSLVSGLVILALGTAFLSNAEQYFADVI
jgi:lipopolysaccharide transport system permease protein